MTFTPEWFRSCREERVAKINNRRWQLHPNDVDKWPSEPHAIDMDNGDKLDLSNGQIWSTRTKSRVGRLSEKELLEVYIGLRLTEARRLGKQEFRRLVASIFPAGGSDEQ